MRVNVERKLCRSMRDGMLDGFMSCLHEVASGQYEGEALHRLIAAEVRKLAPAGYLNHKKQVALAALEGTLAADKPELSYSEWRMLAAELCEEVQLSEIMGDTPGPHTAALRSRLYLAPSELPDYTPDTSPAALQRDGKLDALIECLGFIDEGLDGRPLGNRIIERIFAVWPPDYLEYRKRYEAFYKLQGETDLVGKLLEYHEWCALVDELQRNGQTGCKLSHTVSERMEDLRIKLLRVPGEDDPNVD